MGSKLGYYIPLPLSKPGCYSEQLYKTTETLNFIGLIYQVNNLDHILIDLSIFFHLNSHIYIHNMGYVALFKR